MEADAGSLPFPGEAFDVVIANHCLEHFVNLAPALEEIGRVIKSNGVIFVSVPDAHRSPLPLAGSGRRARESFRA